MRKAIVLASLVSSQVILLAPSMALAGQAPTTVPTGVDGAPTVTKRALTSSTLEVLARSNGAASAPSQSAATRGVGISTPSWSFWIFNYIEGQFCRQRVTTTNAQRATRLQPYSTSAALPDCATPARTPPPGPVGDRLAREFWGARVLPSPVLEMVPAYAITGKLAYLQIHGDARRTFQVDNPLGDDVAITATSSYEIDWGDHSFPHVTSSQGGPWPNGDVTHTYTDTNPAVTITVTQHWSATWAAGASGGELDGLRTSDTLTFPVMQVQAVRNI